MKQQFVQIERRSSLKRDEYIEFMRYLDEKKTKNLIPEPIPFGELSGKIKYSFITPKDASVPDCLDCGVCCTAILSVDVARDDITPKEEFWDITIKDKEKDIVVNRIMRRKKNDTRCIALEGEIKKSISCRIYENRPNLCREFDAGSDRCHALRRAHGIERPLEDHEVARALMHLFAREGKPVKEKIIYCARISSTEEENVFRITTLLEDDSEEVLHEFNINDEDESWLESDFTGLSFEEAKKLVNKNPKR